MNHKEYTDFETEFASIMIFSGILISKDQEEDLVQRLQDVLDNGLDISFETFRKVEAKLSDAEHYELANVIKTFLEYNEVSTIDVEHSKH